MPAEPIQYFNRYTGAVENERVYGDRWLRWTYETSPGRWLLRLLIRRRVFSRLYGWRMDRPSSRAKVLPFIRAYGVDPSEFADPPESFDSFNAFFYRRLKPEARPVAPGRDVAVFPADGRHLVIPDLAAAEGIVVKGIRFDLASFLGDAELAARFRNGAMLLSRLCPVDYHRFHFAVDGTPGSARLLNGFLYSVNPIAVRRNIECLTTNKRLLTVLDSPVFGTVLCLEIGATCVGSVRQTYASGLPVAKGAEKGYFAFGGSSLALFFEPGRLRFDADLVEQSAEYRETYARMGDRFGIARK